MGGASFTEPGLRTHSSPQGNSHAGKDAEEAVTEGVGHEQRATLTREEAASVLGWKLVIEERRARAGVSGRAMV
jgi:hypothetical protein